MSENNKESTVLICQTAPPLLIGFGHVNVFLIPPTLSRTAIAMFDSKKYYALTYSHDV